jgi:catechol 2,3-dioxygenase-like lactoylglutathione lyase family enzyme
MSTAVSGKPVAFLYVPDLDAALAFYEAKLGLKLLERDPFGMFLALGAALLRVTPMEGFTGGPHPVLGWDVGDIAATVDRLSGLGIAFKIYDGMGQDGRGIWAAPGGGAKIAWFEDPFGNLLSLSETGNG